MCRSAALFLSVPAILAAQTAVLDEGRLDPAWFGPNASLQPSKALGFQWLKPGLDLRNRAIQLRAWEAPAWLLGVRARKDQYFLQQVAGSLPAGLERGMRRGLKGGLPVSTASGDLHLVGRVVDAVGRADDYMSVGAVALSFDLKLVDGDTGELLGAFHDTLESPGVEYIPGRFERWCEELGRLFARSAAPAPVAAQVPSAPAFDLEGALRRIEGLKRDGLLSEEEYQALRKKAVGKLK